MQPVWLSATEGVEAHPHAHPLTAGRADLPIPALIFAAVLNARCILPIVGGNYRLAPPRGRSRLRGRPTRRGNPIVSRLGALVALAVCFLAAGYFLGSWWHARDTGRLAQICARVDYVNSLQENLKGPDAASEQVGNELRALVEQCRTALRDSAEEND
jgi:hypothetical protein